MNKICIAVCAALLSPVAFAQDCAAPGGPASTTPFAVSGNTCGGSNEFSAVCGGGTFAGGTSRTYKVNVGSPNNFTATVTPTGAGATYDPAIFFVGPNACSATTSCAVGGNLDDAGGGAAETFSFTGLTPGTWYMVVSSTNLTDPGANCGPFDLTITGTLPVTVQSFSVE